MFYLGKFTFLLFIRHKAAVYARIRIRYIQRFIISFWSIGLFTVILIITIIIPINKLWFILREKNIVSWEFWKCFQIIFLYKMLTSTLLYPDLWQKGTSIHARGEVSSPISPYLISSSPSPSKMVLREGPSQGKSLLHAFLIIQTVSELMSWSGPALVSNSRHSSMAGALALPPALAGW